jgi:hypothetical protein
MTHAIRRTHPRRPLGAAASLVVLVAMLFAAGAADAQRQTVPRPEDARHPRITALEITVEDLDTRKMLEPIAPKGMVFLRVGQRVRLRMTALPAGPGAVRYPSTRFTPNESRYLRIDRNNPEVGSLLVTALRPHGPTGAVPIVYEILEPWPMPEALRSARIYVKVVDDAAPPAPPAPQPVDRGSVTFYQDDDFRGRSQQFFDSDDRLDDNPIGNDTITSVRVSPGCRVILYEHEGFRGRETVLSTDVRTLRGSGVGNDSVSSFRLDCSGIGGRGVTLFSDEGFRGSQERIVADDRDLSDNREVGNDRASSVRVDPGCEAWLYEDADFRGASVYLTGDVPALDRTVLGNDRASSVQVRCR